MIKKVPEATDLIPLGTRDSRYGGKYKPTAITVADFIDSIPIPVTGVQSVVAGTNVTVNNVDPLNPIVNSLPDGVQSIVAGTNVTVNNTDPANPIVNATGGGGTPNPSVIVLNTTDGTIVTGTTVDTLSTSLLIPANTFTTSGILEFQTRSTRNVVGAGAVTFRVYTNTSASLTGATLIATSPTSGTGFAFNQLTRTTRIKSNTLTCINSTSTAGTDYTSTSITTSALFNTSVDNYLLFSCQLVNPADSTYNEMAIATKYI
jgi:hypothetical protein